MLLLCKKYKFIWKQHPRSRKNYFNISIFQLKFKHIFPKCDKDAHHSYTVQNKKNTENEHNFVPTIC